MREGKTPLNEMESHEMAALKEALEKAGEALKEVERCLEAATRRSDREMPEYRARRVRLAVARMEMTTMLIEIFGGN